MPKILHKLKNNPDYYFVLKSLVIIGTILLAENLSGGWGGILLAMWIPFYVVVFAVHFWRNNEFSFVESFWQYSLRNFDLIGIPRTNLKESLRSPAVVTYSLILANVLIYYLFQGTASTRFIKDNLIFIPYSPDWINVPISFFTSMFLHSDSAHLWGNMLFLWAVGTVVECRVDRKFFLWGYFFCGSIANLLAALLFEIFRDHSLHGLGASGAIAGVMGLFAVRCYFKDMIFPIPFFGIFPISYKIRMNALTVIGLFFIKDLIAGVHQLSGSGKFDPINHWAHLGGMLGGIYIAFRLKAQKDASLERREDAVLSILEGERLNDVSFWKGITLEGAIEETRKLLTQKPHDTRLQLHLARLITRHDANEEGRDLYNSVLKKLVRTSPDEALEVFDEFFGKYLDIVDPSTQFLISRFLEEKGNDFHARITYEKIAEHPGTPDLIRFKAVEKANAIM